MTRVLAVFVIIAAITGSSQGIRKIICGEDSASLRCKSDRVLVFQRANYGRTDSSACAQEVVERPCYLHSTIAILSEKCFGKQECELSRLESMFSDPCPQHTKYLDIEYDCIRRSDIYSICDVTRISASRGYITSPGYPWPYPHNRKCTLSVRTPSGRATNVTLIDIEIEARDTRGCFDWLILQEEQYSWLRNDYCGNILTITSPRNKLIHNLQLHLKTDAINQYRGFLLKFYTVDAPDLIIDTALIKTIPRVPNTRHVTKASIPVIPPTPAGYPRAEINNINIQHAQPIPAHPQADVIKAKEPTRRMKDGIHNVDMQQRLLVIPELVNGKLVIPKKRKTQVNLKVAPVSEVPRPVKRCLADDLPLPEFAEVRETRSDLTTYIQCMPGYKMDGAPEAVVACIGGVWVGEPGACLPTGCSEPLSPDHGRVMYPDTREGSEATYRCDGGYILSGKPVRTCLPIGRWSGKSPFCKVYSRSRHRRRHGGIWFEVPLAVAVTITVLLFRKRCCHTTSGRGKLHRV